MMEEYPYGEIDSFYKRTLLKRSLRVIDQIWRDVRKMPLIKSSPSEGEKRRLRSYCSILNISTPDGIDVDAFYDLRGKIMGKMMRWIEEFEPIDKFGSYMEFLHDFIRKR